MPLLNKIRYIITTNNEVTITGYGDFCKGDVVIPDAIDGCPVTSIGDSAFEYCDSLTSITIPDSVTSIDSDAFYGCPGLTSVTIPDSVTSIGDGAFSGCTSLTTITVDSNNTKYSSDSYGVLFNKDKTDLIQYPRGNTRTTYTIPDSVTSIDDFAFYGCRSLTSVIIGNSVTTIDNSVFGLCTSLKSPLTNYKVFDLHLDGKISCRDYEFHENEWSDEIKNIKLCERGYHYCTNLFEIFNYYYGSLDIDIAIYLCEAGGEVVRSNTSKCVTDKIKPVKRLYREDVIKVLNGKGVKKQNDRK